MPLPSRVGLVIGAVMFLLGSYVALHPLLRRGPVTASPLLDLAFATFFLVKGWLYLRPLFRRTPPPVPTPPAPPAAVPPADGPPEDAGR